MLGFPKWKGLIANADISSGAWDANLGLSLPLLPNVLYVKSKYSDEASRMPTLHRVFAARRCNKYQRRWNMGGQGSAPHNLLVTQGKIKKLLHIINSKIWKLVCFSIFVKEPDCFHVQLNLNFIGFF